MFICSHCWCSVKHVRLLLKVANFSEIAFNLQAKATLLAWHCKNGSTVSLFLSLIINNSLSNYLLCF